MSRQSEDDELVARRKSMSDFLDRERSVTKRIKPTPGHAQAHYILQAVVAKIATWRANPSDNGAWAALEDIEKLIGGAS